MAQLQAPGRTPLGAGNELPAKVVGCFFLFTGGIHWAGVIAYHWQRQHRQQEAEAS